ncbi:DUF6641 family protein [Thauera humireducens]|uniref:Uncharacterized protein n=1 Tax=Thauera humireducens TaxID=1134435 RepID=A0A127K5U5_9RHOO|nr:DUF6641 family protein [Thauera humireducens]AMO37313.1 hypothetical protein AC731_010320 [Thauera humireducens]
MTSLLETLNVSAEERFKKLTPTMFRRHKLMKALHEQIEVAEEYLQGRQYMRRFMRTAADPETNQQVTLMTERPARRWFWIDDDGQLKLQVRYGNRTLKVRDEMTTIVIGDKDQLVPVLKLVKQAVEAGELDRAIEAVQRPVGRGILTSPRKPAAR